MRECSIFNKSDLNVKFRKNNGGEIYAITPETIGDCAWTSPFKLQEVFANVIWNRKVILLDLIMDFLFELQYPCLRAVANIITKTFDLRAYMSVL